MKQKTAEEIFKAHNKSWRNCDTLPPNFIKAMNEFAEIRERMAFDAGANSIVVKGGSAGFKTFEDYRKQNPL